jgi:hypothetical protein
VLKLFAKRELQRHVIALAAAYAIALSSLIACFGAARAAADMAAQPGGVICHSLAAGEHAPSSGDSNNKTCDDNCCVGCLMLMAALPPPPVNAAALPLSAGEVVHPLATSVSVVTQPIKSHRSRAPPSAA